VAELTLEVLQKAVTGTAAAFRCRTTLQPAGGEGTKVFPPTYAGGVYATEKRRLPGYDHPVDCVLLDSVQSQANRMEEALQYAIDNGRFKNANVSIPLIEVDFTPYWDPERKNESLKDDVRLKDRVGKISSLQAPHRIADAILRDSLVTKDDRGQDLKTPALFRQSESGRRISVVSSHDATALFELCPTALIFGIWDSTGPKGGLGAKFERAIVAEIVGINAAFGLRTASRVDPVIRKNPSLYETPTGDWTVLASEAVQVGPKKEPKKYSKKLSELNLGNVTPDLTRYSTRSITRENRETVDVMRDDGGYIAPGRVAPGGVTMERAEQTVVLSLAALRRLRFPLQGENWAPTEEQRRRDQAAWTVLASLGLCAAALAVEAGLDLRSRCLLWPESDLVWTLLDRTNGDDFKLSADAAINVLAQAVAAAKHERLPWRDDPLVLTPSKRLVQTVVESQQLAVEQGGDTAEGMTDA
jgi:CRISPR-associated protein Csb1